VSPRRVAFALGVAAVLWAGARTLAAAADQERGSWPKTASTVMAPPPEVARFASLGYRELLADVTWARTLVYFGSSWAGEGDLSQLEQLLDLIVELDPRFKPMYEWAAYAVVFKTGVATQAEYRSSLRYLERAMREFPDDYTYFWIAGSRYYWDLDAPDAKARHAYRERGAALIEEAMRKPNAPPDLATTAANMRSRLGQHERAVDSLRQMVLITDNDEARDKMLERLRVESPDLAEEVERAAEELTDEWQTNMPSVPLDFYVLLGPPPPPVIDFRQLATPHDLFGADEEAAATESEPSPPPATSPPPETASPDAPDPDPDPP
jgi:tetratricopeptide (TPR) repeat protein